RPRQAVVRRGGCDYQIAIRDLLAEDLVVVQAGEVVPVDGTLHESGGRVDEALILGEGSAEQKAVGGPVFAGSRNVGETFVVKTSRRGADTVLGHMLGVVEAARRVRANAQVRGDRLAQRALPIAGAAAFVTFAVWQVRLGDAAVWEALSPALAVLITLTPRALAFASVSALTSGMTSAARLGVLLRDARAIEAIRDLDLMVFEKAGTLTVGRPEVESFEAFGLSAKRALTLLAAVEQRSEHAFAEAITRYASEELAGAATERPEVRSFRTVPGRGVIARVEEHEVVVGSAALLVDKGVAFPEDIIQTVGGSWLFMAVDGRFRARAHLFDPLRQDAVEAVRAATDAGVRPMLVTASAQEEALQVALAVGIAPHDVRSGMDAAEHGEVVRVLKASDRTVGVVGTSGFSSAALSQAHAAIVLRGDASLRDAEYAAILLRPGTGGVRMTLQIAHRTFGAVRQNLLASTVAMGLAVPAGMGMLPPGWALAALLATTVGVGLNGPRLDPGAVGPPVRPVPKA
ncbi:MAG: Cu+-exporting ATPase, partial [Myxococcota bacterium]